MTLFFFYLLGDYCNPQHRVTSIATAFGPPPPPNFQMEITALRGHFTSSLCCNRDKKVCHRNKYIQQSSSNRQTGQVKCSFWHNFWSKVTVEITRWSPHISNCIPARSVEVWCAGWSEVLPESSAAVVLLTIP